MNNYTKGGGRKFQDWSGLVWVGGGTWRGLRRRQEDAWVRDQEPGARQARDTLVSGSLGFSEEGGWWVKIGV